MGGAEGVFWSNEPVQNEDDTRHCRHFLHHHCFAFIAAATNISFVLVGAVQLQAALGRRGRSYKRGSTRGSLKWLEDFIFIFFSFF